MLQTKQCSLAEGLLVCEPRRSFWGVSHDDREDGPGWWQRQRAPRSMSKSQVQSQLRGGVGAGSLRSLM